MASYLTFLRSKLNDKKIINNNFSSYINEIPLTQLRMQYILNGAINFHKPVIVY